MSETQKILYEKRQAYKKAILTEASSHASPFAQFKEWYEVAEQADQVEPNAMMLATVDAEHRPNTRTVLLKAFDERGFVFFTNYKSQKAIEIEQNPEVAIQFLWLGLERQIKIRGRAEKISLTESMQYFFLRPKGSQLGAWVSRQSEVISSRALLVNEYQKLKQKFAKGKVPFPDFWGGYRIVPDYFEFWQGGDDRLHDRLVYEPATIEVTDAATDKSPTSQASKRSWKIKRLAP